MARLDHFFLVSTTQTMSSLTSSQLKTLAPTTDLLITKIPARVKTYSTQYSIADGHGSEATTIIPRAPKDVVHQVRRGEIIFTKKVSAAQSKNVSRQNRSAREPVDACSSLNGYGDGNLSHGDIRKTVVVLGVSETDASFRDGENFPIIAKGLMSVPTIALEPIRKGTLVLAVNPTAAEWDKLIRDGKAHPDAKAGKRTFVYKSVTKSELLPKPGAMQALRNAGNLSTVEKSIVSTFDKLVGAVAAADKETYAIQLARLMAVYALEEECYVLGEAMTSSDPGPTNSFDLKISVG